MNCEFKNNGTVGGYLKHRRRGEDACPMCLTAWRIYYQKQRAAERRARVEAKVQEQKLALAATKGNGS
jgi:hypothetical protein